MEAIGKHDFQERDKDELSFKRGDTLKCLNIDDDKNWYRAELNGREGYIPSNYIDMKPHEWYIQRTTRASAEKMLLERVPATGKHKQKDGAFLVRISESSPNDFSLSVKFGDDVQHFKVLRDGAGKYFLWVVKFDSLNALVEYHRTASVSRSQTIYLRDFKWNMARAIHEFQAKEAEEMELHIGEIVRVIDQTDTNWWFGEVKRAEEIVSGVFPKTYVSLID